jgi:hypothetical protein
MKANSAVAIDCGRFYDFGPRSTVPAAQAERHHDSKSSRQSDHTGVYRRCG